MISKIHDKSLLPKRRARGTMAAVSTIVLAFRHSTTMHMLYFSYKKGRKLHTVDIAESF